MPLRGALRQRARTAGVGFNDEVFSTSSEDDRIQIKRSATAFDSTPNMGELDSSNDSDMPRHRASARSRGKHRTSCGRSSRKGAVTLMSHRLSRSDGEDFSSSDGMGWSHGAVSAPPVVRNASLRRESLTSKVDEWHAKFDMMAAENEDLYIRLASVEQKNRELHDQVEQLSLAPCRSLDSCGRWRRRQSEAAGIASTSTAREVLSTSESPRPDVRTPDAEAEQEKIRLNHIIENLQERVDFKAQQDVKRLNAQHALKIKLVATDARLRTQKTETSRMRDTAIELKEELRLKDQQLKALQAHEEELQQVVLALKQSEAMLREKVQEEIMLQNVTSERHNRGKRLSIVSAGSDGDDPFHERSDSEPETSPERRRQLEAHLAGTGAEDHSRLKMQNEGLHKQLIELNKAKERVEHENAQLREQAIPKQVLHMQATAIRGHARRMGEAKRKVEVENQDLRARTAAADRRAADAEALLEERRSAVLSAASGDGKRWRDQFAKVRSLMVQAQGEVKQASGAIRAA